MKDCLLPVTADTDETHERTVSSNTTAKTKTAPPVSKVYQAHAALFFVGMTFSIMNVIIKIALDHQTPAKAFVFACVRDLCATPLLVVWMFVSNVYTKPDNTRDVLLLAACGIFGIFGGQLFYMLGLENLNPDISAVYQPTGPVVTAVISVSLGLERMTCMKAGGIVVGVAAVIIVARLWDITDTGGAHTLQGHVFFFSGVICSQLFVIFQKYFTGSYDALTITTLAYCFGAMGIAIAVIPVSIHNQSMHDELWNFTPSQLGVLAYCAIISSCLNYYLIVWATLYLPVIVISLYGLLQVPLTDIISYFVLGTTLDSLDVLGAVMVALSLGLTLWDQQRQTMSER